MERRYLLNSITLTCLFVAISDECDTMKMKNNKQSKQKVWEGRPRYGDIYRERTDRAGGEKSKAASAILRDELRLTSVKDGCSEGACGTCHVLIDGKADEGLRALDGQAGGKDTSLRSRAFPTEEKKPSIPTPSARPARCSAASASRAWSSPPRRCWTRIPRPDTRRRLHLPSATTICRCTGYVKIIDGILLAAEILRARASSRRRRKTGYGVG